MSLQTTKGHLIRLLSDSENRVLALSGRWGTGKSHLWKQVKEASADEAVKSALYVSLFGLADMDQVKLKIVQSALPAADQHPKIWQGTKQVVKTAAKALEGLHKSFSALNDLALLVVPSILKNRVIVLDDIERKHEKLSVEEVMGFIDEFTQQYGARLVLILNSDQLTDRGMWEKLREKVVDQELRLETSSSEAFEIAISLTPSGYAERIKRATLICGLTNIRIIRRVIRAVNQILGDRKDLSSNVLDRLIPSTVLLAAIHFKALDEGPNFEFVMGFGVTDWGDWGKKEDELDAAGKLRAKWRGMMHELGISGCDQFERIVVQYLSSGMFDDSAVAAIVERYASEERMAKAQLLANQLHEHVVWHHQMQEAELVKEAASMIEYVQFLDAYNMTALDTLVRGLADGDHVADQLLDVWIAAFRAKEVDGGDFDNFWARPVHPAIKVAMDEAKTQAHANTSLFEACAFAVRNSGWGQREEAVISSATVADFDDTIRSLSPSDLRLFMLKFISMTLQAEQYRKHFGDATDRFVEACRNIVLTEAEGRLAALVVLLFKDSKIEGLLSGPAGDKDHE
ncbi:Uncharacterised protein [Xylophilus ampelinus]|nr:Uncharacterised protein [Xylophilus ampelinus]|tara:strand:+ start:981 stop:2693 length:1713 start_codon:yes stop_codon:yes gene_type:complete